MKRQKFAPTKDETVDTLFRGKLSIVQCKKGYRFSLDALLLAHFVEVGAGDGIVDLGAGNGVIPLILASLYPTLQITGVELQETMVRRALKSVALNRLGDRISMVRGDVCSIKQLFSPQSFDAVVCNPPFRSPTSGRISPDPERRVARNEISARLRDFLRAGFYLLRRGRRMALVYPATRMVDLLQAMREERIEPKRVRLVHSFEGSGAALVLVEGIKQAGSELKIMPPLVIYTKKKSYTSEMKAILEGR